MNVWEKCREAYRQGGFPYLFSKIYHKIRGTGSGDLYEWQHLRQAKAYAGWLAARRPTEEAAARQRAARFLKAPLFSVIVPVYNTRPVYLKALVASILAQTYARFELLLIDGCSTDAGTLSALSDLSATDTRVRVRHLTANEGISGNTNRGIEEAGGDFIVFSDHDDLWESDALYEIAKAINEKDAAFVYTDEDQIHGDSDIFYKPHQKPDFAPETLRSSNYVCHLMAVSRQVLKEAGGLDSRFDGSQDHDLALRIADVTDRVAHVAKVLYHWRQYPQSMSKRQLAKCQTAGRQAVREHLARRGLEGEVTQDFGYRVHYTIRPAKVSVILRAENAAPDLAALRIDSQNETAIRTEFLLLATDATVKDMTALKASDAGESLPVVLPAGQNRYRDWNRAAKRAAGDYLLFLDAGLCPLSEDWLAELLMFAQQPNIGAVGGKLLCPGGKRIFLTNYALFPGEVRREFSGHDVRRLGEEAQERLARNVTAVSEAMMLMKKSDFDESGGFDESYEKALGDVDLCLRLLGKGRRHIYTPFAAMAYTVNPKGAPLHSGRDYEQLCQRHPKAARDAYRQIPWQEWKEAR